MNDRTILLVEDNSEDEELALLALKRNQISNPIVVARDGVEALDYLFARGAYTGRQSSDYPALVLLDLKLPRLNGIEVSCQVREDPRTQFTPRRAADVVERRARSL